ncbi:hypothetical protein BDF20DRAFT_834916 [Mycotypha africana]|uniref:uncharacterized protein n=1 Tax=Mycotypha africana TaxID=64632 RepID=UPI002301AF44|nr:uncharacterized protein BDF20DRAFT_834916 [Mycotypha africana]KAI8982280.1 hypothetical protein BDF20DRAFT_834916 [Mycotypha africana]
MAIYSVMVKYAEKIDDLINPLNATSVTDSSTATDDPLFTPSKQRTTASKFSSHSARTSSPVTNDPLLSGNFNSNDTSSSTPILNHTSRISSSDSIRPNSQLKSSSSSLFGDIDVSKLSQKRVSPNRNVNSRPLSPSKRSSATLKSNSQEDDEDSLFGGSRSSSSRYKMAKEQQQQFPSTPPVPSSKLSALSPPTPPTRIEPQQSQQANISDDNVKKINLPSQRQQPLNSKAEAVQAEQRLPAAPKNEEQTNNKKDNEKQPTSSNSSSFFGFFKSNRHLHSSKSSSLSSSSTVSTIVKSKASKDDMKNSDEQTTREASFSAQPSPTAPLSPSGQQLGQQFSQQTDENEEKSEDGGQLRKKASLFEKYQRMKEKAKQFHHGSESVQHSHEQINGNVEEEYGDETSSSFGDNVQFIEDEATRAFANDLSRFISAETSRKTQPILSKADFFTPELMEGLTINDNDDTIFSSIYSTAGDLGVEDFMEPSPPLMSMSLSTPTTATYSISPPTHVDDPWLDPSVRKPSFALQVEPSQSSPLIVQEQDIEPEKRTAFADLIQSWNSSHNVSGGTPFSCTTAKPTTTASSIIHDTAEEEETFLARVAEERKDIAFAGIEDDMHTGSMTNIPIISNTNNNSLTTISHNNRNTYLDWMGEAVVENPWN